MLQGAAGERSDSQPPKKNILGLTIIGAGAILLVLDAGRELGAVLSLTAMDSTTQCSTPFSQPEFLRIPIDRW